MVDTVNSAGPRKKALGKKERIFHVEKEGREKVQAGQKKFLATLGLTGDRVI